MNPVHFAFLALLFIAVFGTVLVAMRSFAPDPLRQRMDNATGKSTAAPGASAPSPWLARMAVSYTHLTLPTKA